MDRKFVWGVIVGCGLTWGYHKFVKPLPGGSKTGA